MAIQKINPITINIDFDGTCTTHSFPEVGKDIGAVPVLKRLVEEGHQLILFTMRCDSQQEQTFEDGYKIHGGDFLKQAVQWFADNGIPLYGVQCNPTQHTWTTSPKSYAQLMIDDSALGCPLKYDGNLSDRPFCDWSKIQELLEFRGILTEISAGKE